MLLCASVRFLLQRYEYAGAACPKPFWPSRDQAEVQFIPGGLLNPSGGGDRVFLTFGLRTFNSGSRGSSGLWTSFKRPAWRTCHLLKREVKRTIAFIWTHSDEGLVEWTAGSGMRVFVYGQNLCFSQVELKTLKDSSRRPRSPYVNVILFHYHRQSSLWFFKFNEGCPILLVELYFPV